MRRLTKKDANTKLRALSELTTLFETVDEQYFSDTIGAWSHAFARVSFDDNRSVRRAAHVCMQTLATRAGRNIAPHLKLLLAPWIISQFDMANEVQTAAIKSFRAAFSTPEKRLKTGLFCFVLNELNIFYNFFF